MKRLLIGAGHLAPREPGHLNQTGTAGEILFAKKFRDEIAWFIVNNYQAAYVSPVPPGRKPPPALEVLLAPGDLPDGAHVDGALHIHADGSRNAAVRGYSFGYPSDRAAGSKRLADQISTAWFHSVPRSQSPRFRDNYTADEALYYGFNRLVTPPGGFELLIEAGFLSNLEDRRLLGMSPDLKLAYPATSPQSEFRRIMAAIVAVATMDALGFRTPESIPTAVGSLFGAAFHAVRG